MILTGLEIIQIIAMGQNLYQSKQTKSISIKFCHLLKNS